MHRSHPADLQAQPKKTPRLAEFGALAIAGFLLLPIGACAGQSAFSWTDANGQTHFGDRPPQDGNARQVEIHVNTYTASTGGDRKAGEFSASRDIVIYTTQRCGYCKQAKAFLTSHSIPFKEYDVENTARGRADYRKLKGRGVPIILVGEQRMNGYSQDGLSALLRDAGYPL